MLCEIIDDIVFNGRINIPVTGTCEDKGNEADCCAEGCTWAECKGEKHGTIISTANRTIQKIYTRVPVRDVAKY